MEAALLEAARGNVQGHRAVRYAVGALASASRPRSVASVVDAIGLSQRRFIEIFRNEVGVTPKAFARVRGFSMSSAGSNTTRKSTGRPWRSAPGIFDQAHFIHDFREFAGVSPSMYLKHRSSRNHIAVHD